MLEEEGEFSITPGKLPLTIESINEVQGNIAHWRGLIDMGIKYKRIKDEDVHATLLTWFKRLMQLIRRCLTDQQFEEVLAASNLDLSDDFLESNIRMVERNLVSISSKLASVEQNLLKPINNLFSQLNKAKKEIMDKMAEDNEANSENFDKSLTQVKDAVIEAVSENQTKMLSQIEALKKLVGPREPEVKPMSL